MSSFQPKSAYTNRASGKTKPIVLEKHHTAEEIDAFAELLEDANQLKA